MRCSRDRINSTPTRASMRYCSQMPLPDSRRSLPPVRRDRAREGCRRGRLGQRRSASIAGSGDASFRARRAACSPCSTTTRFLSTDARAVVIGRSDIAGKPTALVLGGRLRNATITWCHRHTRDLAAICREADIDRPLRRRRGRPAISHNRRHGEAGRVRDRRGLSAYRSGQIHRRCRFRSREGSRRMDHAQSRRHRSR